MRRPTALFAPLLLLLFCAHVPARCAADAKVKGMAFSTGHNPFAYYSAAARASLSALRSTGANYIHISAYARMSNPDARMAVWQTDQNALRFIFRAARAARMRVFFKPVIEVDKVWRGFIKGDPQWFNQVYLPYITHMARIAQQEKVALFAVGSEYRTAVNNTEQWERVITRVRSVYKGKITYVANHDSFKWVKFWHKLDVISISAYFSLVPFRNNVRYGYSPNLKRTKELWKAKANNIQVWRRNNKLTNKKVLIAEWGVQSKGRGVVYRVPWDWLVRAPVNYYEQVKMYEGMLNAFMPRKWCKGVMLWNWEIDPNAGKTPPSNSWYTPQNKPALKTMIKYFKRKY